ncbi:hypothetical protein ACFOWT_17655 [Croceibacterium xixiisoli]
MDKIMQLDHNAQSLAGTGAVQRNALVALMRQDMASFGAGNGEMDMIRVSAERTPMDMFG